SDDGPAVGQEMTVLNGDQQVGTADAQINLPLAVSAQQGVVSTVYVSENQSVSAGKGLFYLKDKPASLAYTTLVAQRQQAADTLNQAWALRDAGAITAPAGGIVSKVNAADGASLPADETYVELYHGDTLQMVVSIDELDINNVALEQEATVELDALEDQTFTAQVTDISQVGTASGGVTAYSVTLQMDAAQGMKMGMNGTATIIVEQRTGVVLVPLLALQSSKDGQYVWLSGQGNDGEPGIKTAVTTGMSSDTYAEVLTGLSAGDAVVVVRTASSSDVGGMFGGMGGMGGFTAPEGGFTAPEGGGFSREGNGFSGGGAQRPSGGGQ
ncbi:MAG: HlyD family efflux transporter periplasmic adaptor subunit, partial [Eubacteriales bacterium]|nr:HlyD family efflux transporter periplasmic adaptor subunit [Eubacteriales bacterium]